MSKRICLWPVLDNAAGTFTTVTVLLMLKGLYKWLIWVVCITATNGITMYNKRGFTKLTIFQGDEASILVAQGLQDLLAYVTDRVLAMSIKQTHQGLSMKALLTKQ